MSNRKKEKERTNFDFVHALFSLLDNEKESYINIVWQVHILTFLISFMSHINLSIFLLHPTNGRMLLISFVRFS